MRFFWVAMFFVLASAVAYPNFELIVRVILMPLGDTKLYYLTPSGGLSFIIKVCMYVGIVAILPALVYHLYKFIAPVIEQRRARDIATYTSASIFLAFSGIAFCYFVSLPAALHFLTNFDLQNINAMLTIDSYLSFVMAYVIAGALLFQLPLVLFIINSVTPLPPSVLLKQEDKVIIGSFVVAAILSPTPDVVNQALLAGPVILMYQIGIIGIWVSHARQKRRDASLMKSSGKKPTVAPLSIEARQLTPPVPPVAPPVQLPQPMNSRQPKASPQIRSLDGIRSVRIPARPVPPRMVRPEPSLQMQVKRLEYSRSPVSTRRRALDGFMIT